MIAFTLNVDGDSLAAYRWPVDDTHKVLIIIHGYGEYVHRHERLIHAVHNSGVEVFAVDLYGHGMSPGIRGAVKSLDNLVATTHALIDHAREMHPDAEIVLFGHSLGGLTALHAAIKDSSELTRLALSAPATQDKGVRPPLLMAIAPLVAKLFPHLGTVALPVSGISSDEEERQRYDEDENIYRGKVRAGAGWAIIRGGELAHERVDDLQIPTLIIHGEQDPLTAHQGSVRLAEKQPLITLVSIPGGRHELHHEAEESGIPEKFIQTMRDWIVDGTT